MVCFKATDGHERRPWASLGTAGIDARQLPPARVKAFGTSRGTLAKTDRIDAELIARFMAFRPEAGRRLPSGRLRDLRALTIERKQFVEMRKGTQQQTKANQRSGATDQVKDLSNELLERQIAEVDERIERLLANDFVLAETAAVAGDSGKVRIGPNGPPKPSRRLGASTMQAKGGTERERSDFSFRGRTAP